MYVRRVTRGEYSHLLVLGRELSDYPFELQINVIALGFGRRLALSALERNPLKRIIRKGSWKGDLTRL